MARFYKLPFRAKDLMNKKDHEYCDLSTSIAQYLHMIITTSFGELKFDETFGSGVWENDFDYLSSANFKKEEIKHSITKSVRTFEKRVTLEHVNIDMDEVNITRRVQGRRVKQRVTVTISGRINHTNKPFTYRDDFLVGPISYN